MHGTGLPAVRGFRWSRGQDRDRTSGSHQDHFPRQGFCPAEDLVSRKHAEMIVYHTGNRNQQSLTGGTVLPTVNPLLRRLAYMRELVH